MDWDGTRYVVAAVVAFGVVAVRLAWPVAMKVLHFLLFRLGRLARDAASRQKPKRGAQ